MGKERESSPNGKLQFQQHQETFKDKIKNNTEKNISLRPNEELPQLIDGLVQVQENVLADTEVSVASRSNRPQNGTPQHLCLAHSGRSEHVKIIPIVSDSEKQSDQIKPPKGLKQTTCWDFGDRYSQRAKPGPDFGPPIISSIKSKPKRRMTGGPTPINKLGNNDSERLLFKHSNSPLGLPLSSHERRSCYEDQSHKKRRLEASFSHRPIIDVEESRRVNSRDGDRLQISKTGISKNNDLHHPVPELWKVDDRMRIKKRPRSKNPKPSDTRLLHSPKSSKYLLDLKPGKTFSSQTSKILPDPIEDEFGEIDFIPPPETSKRKIGKCSDGSMLQGSEVSSLMPRKYQAQPSLPCTISKEHIQARKHSSKSKSLTSPTSATTSPKKRYKENSNISTSTALLHSDESLDEISISHFDESIENNRAQKTSLDDVKQRKRKFHSNCLSDSFDVDWSPDNVRVYSKDDLSPSALKHSNTSKKSNPTEETYSVLQVFCSSKKWLSLCQSDDPRPRRIWTLRLNSRKRTLAIFDENNEPIPDLDLGRINCVQASINHKKVIISKPSSARDAKGGHRICLELKNSDECERFVSRLKKSDPNVHIILNEKWYQLVRIFEHTLKTAESPTLKSNAQSIRSDSNSFIQEVDDPRLSGSKSSERMSNEPIKTSLCALSSSESRALSKSMTTRSQRNLADNKTIANLSTYAPHSSQKSNKICENLESVVSSGPSRSDKAGTSSSLSPRPSTPEPERWTRSNPNWPKLWHSSIVYPPVGKNKATVDRADIERLDEGEFLNDNLMTFYLRWLQHKTEERYPEIAERVYFHNTFFYERLTKSTKGKAGINYENVERWTSKVNLLKYDYIVVPVNENFHWYVAIICHAPKLLDSSQISSADSGSPKKSESVKLDTQKFSDPVTCPETSPRLAYRYLISPEVNVKMKKMNLNDHTKQDNESEPDPVLLENSDSESSPAVEMSNCEKTVSHLSGAKYRKRNAVETRIITLDSFGHSHSLTCTNLKKYLLKEIESKLKIKVDDPGNLGRTAKNIPQQDNFFDCGLFVLGYVEIFLRDPDAFISSLLQNKFPGVVAWPKPSEMRSKIRSLLFKLQNENFESVRKRKQEKTKIRNSKKAFNLTNDISSISHEEPESSKVSAEKTSLDLDGNSYIKSQKNTQSKYIECHKSMSLLERENSNGLLAQTAVNSVTKNNQLADDISETPTEISLAIDTNHNFSNHDCIDKTNTEISKPCLSTLIECQTEQHNNYDSSTEAAISYSSIHLKLESNKKRRHSDSRERSLVSRSKYFDPLPLNARLLHLEATLRQALSDVSLGENDNMICNKIDEAHQETSLLPDHHNRDPSSRLLEESPRKTSLALNFATNSTINPKPSPLKNKHDMQNLLEKSDPSILFRSMELNHINHSELEDDSLEKRRRLDKGSTHPNCYELSSTSWQRDSLEKALVNTVSRSSTGVSDTQTCRPREDPSHIIVIE